MSAATAPRRGGPAAGPPIAGETTTPADHSRWHGADRRRRFAPFLPLLDEIVRHGAPLVRAADGELSRRVAVLRRQSDAGTTLDDLLPEWFALVRELAHRTLGERPYEVQLLAGIALHRGTLAEMQTGEGKTLAAVAPVSLAALAGRGIHVLTFNDYLARRDAAWMGPIYRRLGLTVGIVQEGIPPSERRQAYACDVTYATVKEAGFDLLRDGLCLEPDELVHRPFHLAVVDEADSILIDEARIPLVIAGTMEPPGPDLCRLAAVVRQLRRGADFDTDEYARNIFLTDRGIQRAEALLGCDNLFEGADNIALQAQLRNALHAEALLRRDVDYIVRDGRIELVDELTGRVVENRHWPDGLQSALEAKEGLSAQPEGRILGSITIQHFLHAYPRLAGMTATAGPAADELAEVYGLKVTAVPTHRPCIREDLPDLVFTRQEAKRRALVVEIARVHATDRPILVGTASVDESERLAAELRQSGLDCRVLNARNDAEEAEIVAEAGRPGAVTISTNMAGRGTDIRLGGSDERGRERVLALGGLYVIGTNRHESRRIDDQLRGRAGRQGDPGTSRFLISLEDPLLRRYGLARLVPARLVQAASAETVDHPAVHREVARAQRIVEGQCGDIRSRLMRYAGLLERQRADLQEWRREVLDSDAALDLLARRRPEQWSHLCAAHGEELATRVERRLTLLAIDRCWSDHLAEMQAVRDEVHLVTLDGRDPLAEFYRTAGRAFDGLFDRIDEAIVEAFETLPISASGVDWDAAGLRGPSSTWTYLVNDTVFAGNPFLTLATRHSIGLWATLLLGPLLFLWAAALHWRRWWSRRRRRDGDTSRDAGAAGPAS
jgi:preprotein translocase subunit SecA